MEITGRKVVIPDELRGDRVVEQGEVEPSAAKTTAVAAALVVVMLILGTTGIGLGVGLWVHPGAGLAAAGLVTVVVATLLAFQV